MKKKRGKNKFPGIGRHAKILGRSRVHLYFVLTGQRESKPLMKRYRALLLQEEKNKTKGDRI